MFCIIPCAGLGTRLRPLTRVVPKELLPFGDRPLLEHVVEEVREAGIDRLVIVLRPEKEIIRAHLEAAGIQAEYVMQKRPNGQADALRAAYPIVGDAPFLMALPDQQLRGASSQLMARYTGQDTLSSLVALSPEDLPFFPGASGFALSGSGPLYDAHGLKPDGDLRGFGRTLFGPGFLAKLPEDSQEGDFGRILAHTLSHGHHQALQLTGQPADLGTMPGYLRWVQGF